MIKISKNFLFNPAQIRVTGIKCNFNNIIKIIDILDCKWIVMTIDSLSNDSLLLALFVNQGLKYYVKQRVANNIEVSAVLPYPLFKNVLENAISEDPENIFLLNLLNPKIEDIHLQHSFEELISTGMTDMFISISLDENAILIAVNKSLIQPKELYRRIKALRFD